MKNNTSPLRQRLIWQFIGVIVLSIVVALRFFHLDADPQPSYVPMDVGYLVDEGNKTFAAKNLLLFGAAKWHPSDSYLGWMKHSPVTQWPYYYAFKLMGLELKNARMVTAIYSALFFALAFYFLNKRYGLALALTAILLLTSDAALFYFSRSALFEIAVILFVYTGILVATCTDTDKPIKAAAVMMIFMFVATYALKRSAIVYYLPPIFACISVAFIGKRHSSRRNVLYITLPFLAILSLIYMTRKTWLPRIDITSDAILNFPREFLLNVMPDMSPLALLLGYSCILHILLVKPELFINNLYRLSLTAIIIGGPIIVLFFESEAPRYFVPIIPACLLLTVEWFHLKPWYSPMRNSFTISQKLAVIAVFITFSMLMLRAVEMLILRNLPFNIGEDPGIDKSTLFVLFPFFLTGVYGYYYLARASAIKLLGFSVPLLTLASIITGLSAQARTLTHPVYDTQPIRSALSSMIGADESVAGVLAPLFTAEAPIRSLFMIRGTNFPYPEHIDKIRPNYFLCSDIRNCKEALDALEGNDALQLGKPRYMGTYFYHDVTLYPIGYFDGGSISEIPAGAEGSANPGALDRAEP